jgi:tRNA-2-methylthio-N6-dimethylallyladenosine synthase
MKRNYLYLEYKNIIRKLRTANPEIKISSDFIVGFPGETDEDHKKTIKAIKELDLDYSYSFLYSPRPGTPAAFIKDETPLDVKKNRLNEIQELIAMQGKKHTEMMLNTYQRVLITNEIEHNIYKGKTDNNRVVEVSTEKPIKDKLINVHITDVSGKNLNGDFVNFES